MRAAGRLAQKRRRKLVSIDKANVLETSRLWRAVVTRVMRAEFPDVTLEHMLVDSAAMHLIRRPRDFDVLVTENMFGDILTDEASMLAGSLGVYANLRPVTVHPALLSSSTLKPEVIEGVDLLFVRELTGGIYFGEKHRDTEAASDLCTYTFS